MTARFANLTKVPNEPAAKFLAKSNLTLDTKVTAPTSAPVDVVLKELAEAEKSDIDMLRLLAAILPVRERVWWACLAARDIIGPGVESETPSVRAAEAWVFRPTDENREAAIVSLDQATVKDLTRHCAMAVAYCDDTLGPGEMAEFPAPPGASALAAFSMNLEALVAHRADWDGHLHILIDRALDIARGGNGKGEKA
ncbi:hypothetical protein SAMN05443551_1306 [Marivita hallyeonensis]|uniref:Uncharacterized protein n=1 Tax=Marivita hallyeonensis TaxID=996342 RepID=A0A1M5PHU8_9RHOB|nr:hypothetical protein SAMN05443551_1306 [Marivita hallyeonensis]